MNIYVIVDTNVFVSILLSHKKNTATQNLFELLTSRDLILVYNEEILDEYIEVFNRPKFKFGKDRINLMVNFIMRYGKQIDSEKSQENFVDLSDAVFYEVTLGQRKYSNNTFLVTGNLKHFPVIDFVVNPEQMIKIYQTLVKNQEKDDLLNDIKVIESVVCLYDVIATKEAKQTMDLIATMLNLDRDLVRDILTKYRSNINNSLLSSQKTNFFGG